MKRGCVPRWDIRQKPFDVSGVRLIRSDRGPAYVLRRDVSIDQLMIFYFANPAIFIPCHVQAKFRFVQLRFLLRSETVLTCYILIIPAGSADACGYAGVPLSIGVFKDCHNFLLFFGGLL